MVAVRLDLTAAVVAVSRGPLQARIAMILAEQFGSFVRTRDIVAAIYGVRADGGALMAMECARRTISKMRPRLEAIGLAIDGNPKKGHRLRAAPQPEDRT